MAGQPQQTAAAAGVQVLGEVGLIGDQHRARRRQLQGQPRPAMQLQVQAQGQRLTAPVVVQAHRSQHHDAAIRAPHHGPRRSKGGEGLTQAHGIGQHRAPTGQQPAGRGPLVGKQLAAVRQRSLQGSGGDELAMGR
jgi:hypothetical protein